MPKHREELHISASLDDAVRVVERALGELRPDGGWQRPQPDTARLRCKQPMNLLSFHNPASVEVSLRESGGLVRVVLDGSNFGFGPLQARHVVSVVEEMRQRIETASGQTSRTSDAPPPVPGPTEVTTPAVPPPPPPPASVESRVFVSYRREDSGHVTDRVCEGLSDRLGAGAIFKDIDDIPLGVNFEKFIRERIGGCDVLLAVIGREWAGEGEEPGTSRLDSDADYVRIEVEAALQRGIPVIPVLIRGARVPPAETLPESLRELPKMNGIEIRRGHDFSHDLARLADQLERLLAER